MTNTGVAARPGSPADGGPRRGRRGRPSLVTLVCLVLMILASVGAWLLVDLADREPAARESIPTPRLLVLTDRADLAVLYAISYHRGSSTGPSGTVLTEGNVAVPSGAQRIDLTFRSARRRERVRWALLEDRDAALTNATAVQRLGDVSVTRPGDEIDSPCDELADFPTAQVISGETTTDDRGRGRASIVGGVPPSVHYTRVGERTAVNVVRFLSPAANGTTSGSGSCHANLIDWEQVGGADWQTPRVSSGTVTVGDVPDGQFVESANPPLTDVRTLSWNLDGPASVSYTLFDTGAQAQHEVYVFLAGVLAALGAALLVEVIKGVSEWINRDRALTTQRPAAPGTTAEVADMPAPATTKPAGESSREPDGARVLVWLAVGGALGWTTRAVTRHARRRRPTLPPPGATTRNRRSR